MRVRVSLITLLALLTGGLVSAPAPAQEQIPALTHYLSAQQRREDPRLERPVTVWQARIQIGELLEVLSQQTGIETLPGDRDGSANEIVTVFVKERPVFEVLNALWSLVSYRGAEWHWRRSGAEGNYRYRLIRPDEAEKLRERFDVSVRMESQAALAAATARASAALHLPPEELRRRAAADPIALQHLAESEFARLGLRIFNEVLDAETRQAALAGDPNRTWLMLKVKELPEWARAALRAEAARRPSSRRDPDTGEPLPSPVPEALDFFFTTPTGPFGPTLSISTDTFWRQEVIGGEPLRRALRERLKQGWLRLFDRPDDPAETRVLPEIPVPPPLYPGELVRLSFNGHTRASRFEYDTAETLGQLAAAADLPLVAAVRPLRRLNSVVPASQARQTLREYLDRFAEGTRRSSPVTLVSKWRGDVLLVLDTEWLTTQYSAPPWEMVKALREAEAAAADGFLPLEVMALAARELDPRRLVCLAEFFPMLDVLALDLYLPQAEVPVGGAPSPALQFVMLGPLRLYATSEELATRLRSEEGVPVAELRPLAVPLESESLARLLAAEGAAALRVVVEDDLEHAPPLRWVRFQTLGADGRVVSDLSFNYWRRPLP